MELIETLRLKLEPFTESHLSGGIVEWLNDPEVVRYSDNRHRRHSCDSSRAYLDSFRNSPNCYWAILLGSGPPRMIGSITAYVDVNNRVADVGILVGDKRFWGGGYGSEAFSGVVGWLFSARKMRKVTAGTMAANTGMIGIMRKLGMREEARGRRHYLLDQAEIDMVCGAIFAEDWQAGNTTQAKR